MICNLNTEMYNAVYELMRICSRLSLIYTIYHLYIIYISFIYSYHFQVSSDFVTSLDIENTKTKTSFE